MKIDVKTTGPFFQYGGRPIADATSDLVRDLIKEGEARVEAELYPGHGVATGEFRRGIHATVKSANGVIETSPGGRDAIIGKFLERGRTWPSTGHRFPGLFMFRKGAQHLRRLAGLVAGRHVATAVRRLN